MDYLMTYNQATGEITGFYPSDLLKLYGEIPQPNLKITEQKHDFYAQHNGQYKLNPETLVDEPI